MGTILSFLFRLVLLAAGLVIAASLAVAAAFLLLLWGLRAAWGRLTGRPVMPFVMRVHPRGGFDSMVRRGAGEPAVRERRNLGDVTDVEPK